MSIQLLFFGPGLSVDTTALPDSPASPVSPYGPFYHLFYEGRSVKFSFKEILHCCAYRYGVRSNLFHPLSMGYTATSVLHHAILPFKVSCIYFGNYFKIIILCACRCQCLQSSQLKNLLPDCILQPASILLTIKDTVSLETRSFLFLGTQR